MRTGECGYIHHEEKAIWGFDRVIKFISEKAGGFGLFGPRNVW